MIRAKCGAEHEHGAHRYGPRDGDWCAGNINIVEAQIATPAPCPVPDCPIERYARLLRESRREVQR